jgi:RNA polymerase primary sigma factor
MRIFPPPDHQNEDASAAADKPAEHPIDSATRESLAERIDQILQTLTQREREIIKLRYGLSDGYAHTLEEIGRIFDLTREHVREIEARVVTRLRDQRGAPGEEPAHRTWHPRLYIEPEQLP